MGRKLQTKLIRDVCKRAAAKRAPYRHSSYTNKTVTIKKKTSSQTKTKVNVQSKLLDLNAQKISSSTSKKKEPIYIKQA